MSNSVKTSTAPTPSKNSMHPKQNILRSAPLIFVCLSLGINAEEVVTSTVYSPIESINEIASSDVYFPGSSLPVYDAIDLADDNKITPVTSLPKPLATLSQPVITRGEISSPQAKPITENLVRNLSLSLGAIALSTTLDRSGDTFARQHGQNTVAKGLTKVGNALPFVAFGLAGLAFLDDDPRLSRTGLAALQAGGIGAATGLGLKLAFGRSRPELNQGPAQFHAAGSRSSDSSMPSIHNAMTWGVITPFAKEYDMPWLYGVAALTNMARITDRKHWVSDTVAGSLLGYWLGDIAWNHNRRDDRSGPQVSLGNRNLAFGWTFN